MIRVSALQKAFGTHKVLDGIDLTVNDGEVVALIGPSGTGKTTLLRAINFLEPADAGSVTIGDLTVSVPRAPKRDVLALRRRTAMVFQSYNLFKNKTAAENVSEGLRVVKRIPKDEARRIALEHLARVGLTDHADKYPSQLSGGQQQRVGIARSLALEPEVLLLDEPTASLDPSLSAEVLDIIRQVARSGITMIISTHEMEFARSVAQKVVLLDQGRVAEQGSPEEIFGAGASDRVRRFIGRAEAPATAA